MSGETERIHGTAVALGRRAALIRGASGAGKSDLAFRCIGLGASSLVGDTVRLVADDQVILKQEGPGIVASAPSTIRGKLEVRGLGILEVDTIAEAELVLIADLVSDGSVERYPDPWPEAHILGLQIPLIRLYPFESSSALKLVTAIAMAPRSRFAP
ncbi:MAG: HPr kinase/phosphatase C-terminal domain-containing protein [Proteobacteria bacterium]|nr:HPr kinase/phosphatase C-terminal domain-containing protein [Pseudomonadota bacterium]